jgi:DNA-binding PadR family transcriptional regulator
MATWAEQHKQIRLEQAKLLTLRFLSEPENQPHGENAPRISAGIHDAGADIQSYDLRDVLKVMVADGLLEVGGSHPRNGNIRKPYRITQRGRDYLAEAAKRASTPAAEPEHVQASLDVLTLRSVPPLKELSNSFLERLPQDWTTLVLAPRVEKLAADFIRRLPEFDGSDEARIQEVSRGLAEAIGLPAPQTPRSDAEGVGR